MKTTDSIPNFVIELLAFDWKGVCIDLRTTSDDPYYINKTSLTVSEFDSIPSTRFMHYDSDRNRSKYTYFWSSAVSVAVAGSCNGIYNTEND